MNKEQRDLRDALNPSLFETVFFVGAPPRSGNTYLRYVLKDSYNNPLKDPGSLIKHDHSSSYALDQSLKPGNDSPIFITPIRDPYDTLKSKLVRTFYEWDTVPNVIEYAPSVDDLCLYWEILLTAPDKFCLIDFRELVADKDRVVSKINSKYPEVITYKNPSPLTNEQLLAEMKEEDDNMYGNNVEFYLSYAHTPRGISEYSKQAQELLASPAYKRRLEYLYEMYRELLELTL